MCDPTVAYSHCLHVLYYKINTKGKGIHWLATQEYLHFNNPASFMFDIIDRVQVYNEIERLLVLTEYL